MNAQRTAESHVAENRSEGAEGAQSAQGAAPRRSRRGDVGGLLVALAVVLVVAVSILVGARHAVLLLSAVLGALGLLRPFTDASGILRARGRLFDTVFLLAAATGLALLSGMAETADVSGF